MLRPLCMALIIVCAVACDNEKDKVYPVVQTGNIEAVAASSFKVSGSIAVLGDTRVQKYGFVYALTPQVDIYQGTLAEIHDVAGVGNFQTTITLNLPDPTDYTLYVRTFLTNERGTVYGDIKQLNVPLLHADNVTPLIGRTGDIITITGNNFSTAKSDNTVTFNGIEAEVTDATSTQLKVKVPPGILYPAYKEYNTIDVATANQTVRATSFFKVLPSVTSFAPLTGTFGTTVTISGSDFYPAATSVRMGGVEAIATTVGTNTVTFNVPLTVTSETLQVQLVSGTTIIDVIDVPGTFTMNKPTIASITPLTGIGGAEVVITGTNFNVGEYNYTYNVVKFGNLTAEAFNAGTNKLLVRVPLGLPLGQHKISVFTGVHTVTSAGNFTLASPKITSFTPAAGPAFSFITITGTNFGTFNDKISAVLVGATIAEVFSWTDTQINIRIPAGTPPGAVTITVNAGAQSAASASLFNVQ